MHIMDLSTIQSEITGRDGGHKRAGVPAHVFQDDAGSADFLSGAEGKDLDDIPPRRAGRLQVLRRLPLAGHCWPGPRADAVCGQPGPRQPASWVACRPAGRTDRRATRDVPAALPSGRGLPPCSEALACAFMTSF